MRHVLLIASVLVALDAGAATFAVDATADQPEIADRGDPNVSGTARHVPAPEE